MPILRFHAETSARDAARPALRACPCCSCGIGDGFTEKIAVPEPNGPEIVCRPCAEYLDRWAMSTRQKHAMDGDPCNDRDRPVGWQGRGRRRRISTYVVPPVPSLRSRPGADADPEAAPVLVLAVI